MIFFWWLVKIMNYCYVYIYVHNYEREDVACRVLYSPFLGCNYFNVEIKWGFQHADFNFGLKNVGYWSRQLNWYFTVYECKWCLAESGELPCPEVGNGFVFYEKLPFLSAGVGIANDVSVWFLVSLSLTIVVFLSLTIVMLCCLSFQGWWYEEQSSGPIF